MPTRTGPSPGNAVDRHDSAEPLGDLIDAGSGGIGSVLAEAGDAAVDDARIDRPASLVVDSEAVLDIGAVVLDDHVGGFGEAQEDLARLGLLEVERERALVAVEVEEVARFASAGDALGRARGGGLFDLEHIRAPVAELAGGGGSGAGAGQVEDEEVFKGQCGHWSASQTSGTL